MVLDKLVNTYYDDLNDNDLHIITIIHQHETEMKKMKIQDLAQLAHTSISSIHRLCRKLGLEGYGELKTYIKMNLSQTPLSHDAIEMLEDDIRQTIKHINQLDFSKLNRYIDEAPFIYIYGTGTAQNAIANDFQRQLLSLHKKSTVINNEVELLHVMNIMSPEEVLFIISLSGNTNHLENIIKTVKTRHIQLISLTVLHDNFLAQNAMFNIYVSNTPFMLYNQINYSSFTTFYVAFDIIVRKYSFWKMQA